MSSNSILNGSFEETRWILQISELIEREDLQTALETPLSIFKLSDSLTNENPEAYFPNTLALGPYHHFNPKLYKMEIFKLEKAKEAKEIFHLLSFHQIVEELKPLELKIRAYFDRYLEMGSETLAWIMLIDGLFLLRLLAKENTNSRHTRKLEFPLPIFEEQKWYGSINGNLISQCEIVNDILKLENQIPTLVLEEISHRNDLHILFYQFCVSISPTVLTPYIYDSSEFMDRIWNPNLEEIFKQSYHLLHFLYLLIMNQRTMTVDSVLYYAMECAGGASASIELLNIFSSIFQIGFLQQLNEAVGLIQSLFGLLGRVNKSSREEGEPATMIPSALKLKKVKLKLEPKKFGGIKNIEFDKKTVTLTLPVITINPFCEVIFRNLMAFEAMAKMDPPCFTQYIAVMSGLMATAKDVTILKEADIVNICNDFTSDEDIVKMFNGLRKTIDSNYSSFMMENGLVSEAGSTSNSNPSFVKMDEIIKEINKYYESCWRVKAKRFMEKYIWSVLKALFFLVIILLVVFVVVRTFCGWFSCPKILRAS